MSDLGGLNPNHAVAGFGGALASLPFMRPASWWLALGAITAGLTTAIFMTPVVAEILAIPRLLGSPLTARAELGLAFLLGLTAMILIPAILGFAAWVKDNVSKIMERVTGTTPPTPPGGSP